MFLVYCVFCCKSLNGPTRAHTHTHTLTLARKGHTHIASIVVIPSPPLIPAQNGRTPRDVAVEYGKEEVVALIDREVYLRKQEELREVSTKVTSEWGAILKAKVASK